MTKEARQERRELWAERIEAFLSSGLSQRAWCREHGLRPNHHWYRLRKYATETNQPQSGKWIQLDSLAPTGTGVVLRLGNVTEEIQRGFAPQLLTEVIRSLLNE